MCPVQQVCPALHVYLVMVFVKINHDALPLTHGDSYNRNHWHLAQIVVTYNNTSLMSVVAKWIKGYATTDRAQGTNWRCLNPRYHVELFELQMHSQTNGLDYR